MKKVCITLLLIVSSTIMAGGYGMAGCGLGSMVIKDNGTMQIFAATTNGTSASQTFGITTGTSNCTEGGVLLDEAKKIAFIEATLPQLKQDTASGKGEYLSALGSMYQCNASASQLFNTEAQKNFQQIFKSGHQAKDVQKAVDHMIQSNETLKNNCII